MAPLRPIQAEETVAVTIATRNRPHYLAALLASLVNQTYPHWMLVLNDQSDTPVSEVDAIADLIQLLRTRGHVVETFRSSNGRERYQELMDAVPEEIDFVLRVDDDVMLTPSFVQKILRPYEFFPELPLGAVGPCLPEPHMRPLHLETRLAEPDWTPRIDRPVWRLQGHAYTTYEILDVESLWGSAMCYRRTAAREAGGWVIPGLSEQIFREDSDMSARLLASGYHLMVTTEALGWHLVAPAGGARRFNKTPQGNVLASDRRPFEADDEIFRRRMAELLADGVPRRELKRYRIFDLEKGLLRPRAVRSWRGRVLRGAERTAHRALRPVREAVRYVRGER